MEQILIKSQLKKIYYLALILWSMAITVTTLTFFNIDVADYFPFVWVLHLGIFAIILPIILSQKAATNEKKVQKFNLISIFKGAPIWLSVLVIGGILYAVIGFFVFNDGSLGGKADLRDGQYIVHNRGTFVKNITEKEYHTYNAEILQGFSIIWIWLYGFGMAMLHKINRDEEIQSENKNGNS